MTADGDAAGGRDSESDVPTGEAVVVHDGAIHPGGAVDVVLEAARVLDADLVVGVSGMDESWWIERAPNDVRVLTERDDRSTLSDALLARRLLNLSLDEYDLALTSGPAATFYQPYDDQRVVHYVHHPPLSSLWFDGGLLSYLLKVIDRTETRAVETLLANSALTANRMAAHYGREPDAVVNPPVDVDRFRPDTERDPSTVVMAGRLEERKRVELAVEAFDGIGDVDGVTPELHLLGDGPLRADLAARAPPNVRVRGYVDDEDLVTAIERASAGLFLAKREDFGIVPVELLAAGTPVVGVDEPNTNRQVTDGETGVLVEPEVAAVREGVRAALSRSWDRGRLRAAAEGYGTEAFRSTLVEALAANERIY